MKKRILQNLPSAIIAVLMIALGIMALVNRELFSTTLGWVCGLVFLGFGALLILYVIFIKSSPFGTIWLVMQSIVLIVVGIILVSYRQNTIQIITYTLGAWLLLSGIGKIITGLSLRLLMYKFWFLYLIVGIIFVSFAFTLFFFDKSSDVITILLGIFLTTSGTLNMVDWVVNKVGTKGDGDTQEQESNFAEFRSYHSQKNIGDSNHIDVDFTEKDN